MEYQIIVFQIHEWMSTLHIVKYQEKKKPEEILFEYNHGIITDEVMNSAKVRERRTIRGTLKINKRSFRYRENVMLFVFLFILAY